MTREQVNKRLAELGVRVRRVWFDEAGHLAIHADMPDLEGEERAVLSSRVLLIFSEYYKAHGGPGLKFAAPTEFFEPGDGGYD